MKSIDTFDGEYVWLSNFYPCVVRFEEHVFPSVENAYQAAKFPSEERDQFVTMRPGVAKKLGRTATLPGDWNLRRIDVMITLLRYKFEAGTGLAAKLMATGDAELIEGNYWNDTFWGVYRGKGENMLGQLLMAIRAELQGA